MSDTQESIKSTSLLTPGRVESEKQIINVLRSDEIIISELVTTVNELVMATEINDVVANSEHKEEIESTSVSVRVEEITKSRIVTVKGGFDNTGLGQVKWYHSIHGSDIEHELSKAGAINMKSHTDGLVPLPAISVPGTDGHYNLTRGALHQFSTSGHGAETVAQIRDRLLAKTFATSLNVFNMLKDSQLPISTAKDLSESLGLFGDVIWKDCVVSLKGDQYSDALMTALTAPGNRRMAFPLPSDVLAYGSDLNGGVLDIGAHGVSLSFQSAAPMVPSVSPSRMLVRMVYATGVGVNAKLDTVNGSWGICFVTDATSDLMIRSLSRTQSSQVPTSDPYRGTNFGSKRSIMSDHYEWKNATGGPSPYVMIVSTSSTFQTTATVSTMWDFRGQHGEDQGQEVEIDGLNRAWVPKVYHDAPVAVYAPVSFEIKCYAPPSGFSRVGGSDLTVAATLKTYLDSNLSDVKDQMDFTFGKVMSSLDNLYSLNNQVKKGLARVDLRVSALDYRVSAINNEMAELTARVDNLSGTITDLTGDKDADWLIGKLPSFFNIASTVASIIPVTKPFAPVIGAVGSITASVIDAYHAIKHGDIERTYRSALSAFTNLSTISPFLRKNETLGTGSTYSGTKAGLTRDVDGRLTEKVSEIKRNEAVRPRQTLNEFIANKAYTLGLDDSSPTTRLPFVGSAKGRFEQKRITHLGEGGPSLTFANTL